MPYFNSSNASNFGKLGAIARKRIKEAMSNPDNPPPLTAQKALPAYIHRRLARVRKQLDLVDKRIEDEASKQGCDGQLLNWLCQAQDRLSDQERILDNRPLPGSRRPTPERPLRKSYTTLPPPEPLQVVAPPRKPEAPGVSDSGSNGA